MEIRKKKIDGNMVVLELDGEMDLYNASDFKNEINTLFGEPQDGIVVDLGSLNYIDSSGISAMLYTFTQSKNRNMGLCFVNIRGSVRKVIELTSLSGFFPIADDVVSAVEKIKAAR